MYCQKCGAQLSENGICPNCRTLQPGKVYCKFCGEVIDSNCVVCPKCGRQVGEVKAEQPNIVINNSNQNTNANANFGFGFGRPCNKWIALTLCILFGYFGAHKFYEGKTGMGILYLFTLGLFGIGWIVDIISIALKPNPYFV